MEDNRLQLQLIERPG